MASKRIKYSYKVLDNEGAVVCHQANPLVINLQDGPTSDWEKMLIDLKNQGKGAELSANIQHGYGKQGEVAPEIGGFVKPRRKDRQS